jgi:hypothetical protein
MLDDLRNSASAYEEATPQKEAKAAKRRNQSQQGTFLGMTAPQRFILVFILLIMTCVCGSFALLIFEKVVPPFF